MMAFGCYCCWVIFTCVVASVMMMTVNFSWNAPYSSQMPFSCQVQVTKPSFLSYENKTSAALRDYSVTETYLLCLLADTYEEGQKRRGLHKHGFNELVSERIGPIRAVPDVRNSVCTQKIYEAHQLTASVVMCFYNEAWSTLLRSVHSILYQTPPQMLKEIVLFDDFSSYEHLGHRLEKYISQNFTKVKLIRSEKRLGLIRARMEAAKNASGQVLVFLDSHIETGQAWLEPLLDRISKDRTTVVIPVVDTIEAETMIYRGADLMRSGFTWSLLHNWEPLPSDVELTVNRNAEPFKSPTMPGGLFAIDRKYFHDLGEYDDGMDIWGGENMEISFRIWMCGGRLEIVPCSRVGHVFRMFRPYGSPTGEDTATKNAARVAEVWLDEYKKHFWQYRPGADKMDYGKNISKRIALREKLNCRSFKWYLEEVYPEQHIPGEESKKPSSYRRPVDKYNEKLNGKIIHEPSGLCVNPKSHPAGKNSPLVLSECDKIKSEKFILTTDYQIRLNAKQGKHKLCLETTDEKSGPTSVYLMKCHAGGGAQTWLYEDIKNCGLVLFNPASGKCLAVTKSGQGTELGMDFCTSKKAQGFYIQGL